MDEFNIDDEGPKPEAPINPIERRDHYKKERLNKIQEMRQKERDMMPIALTTEEINSKPTKQQVKMTPISKPREGRDPMHLEMEKNNEDSYM